MHDVVIVGAGPGGATTAIGLSRLGHSVQLLDRAAFPRRKGCGEGLFSRGSAVLHELGAWPQVASRARVLESLRVELDGAVAEARLGRGTFPAIGVRREVLDGALFDLAASAGADVCTGVTATGLLESSSGYRGVRTDHGDFEARVIVAAGGLRSRLRRLAGLDAGGTSARYGASAHFFLPEEPAPRVHIRMMRGFEVYVTPVGDSSVNVALLMGKQRARSLAGDVTRAYEAAVRESGVLPQGARLAEEPLVNGPFPAAARRAWRENLVLAGDAAGFFDGISGEGMSLALVSAGHAAQAIHAYLRDGDTRHFAAYEGARRGLARNSTWLARISLLLAGHPSLGRRVIANLGRRPDTFEKVLAINAGTSGLGDLRPGDLANLAGI